MPEQVLSDVKVLDLTWYITGPYCTKQLADYGADVIKVEKPPDGDPVRRMGPFYKDEPHPEKSGLFLHLNTNKRGITLNLKNEAGKKIFKELVKWADILVESFSPRVMPSLGLDYETLEKINPRLLVASISNFGQWGPYRDFKLSELVLYGMGGPMYMQGLMEREPVKLGGSVIQFQTGNRAVVAIMTALRGCWQRGDGEHLDISLYEFQMGMLDRKIMGLVGYQYTGDINPRLSTRRRGYAAGIFPCEDGYFSIGGGGRVMYPRLCRMLGKPELIDDPRYSADESLYDPAIVDEFNAMFFYPWLEGRTKNQAWAGAQAAGIYSAPINTPGDLFTDPSLKERNYFVEIDHPTTGKLKYPGAPIRMTKTPWQVKRPAPLLGEHNEEVYGMLGYTREDVVKLREMGAI